jgi:hypothetical protein
MDLQAQDRAHRIGQTRPVLIFRLVSRHTIESKIMQRASEKRQLEALVIAKGKCGYLYYTHPIRHSLASLSHTLFYACVLIYYYYKKPFPHQVNSRCQSVAVPKLVNPDRR